MNHFLRETEAKIEIFQTSCQILKPSDKKSEKPKGACRCQKGYGQNRHGVEEVQREDNFLLSEMRLEYYKLLMKKEVKTNKVLRTQLSNWTYTRKLLVAQHAFDLGIVIKEKWTDLPIGNACVTSWCFWR